VNVIGSTKKAGESVTSLAVRDRGLNQLFGVLQKQNLKHLLKAGNWNDDLSGNGYRGGYAISLL
jgi:hypothetical protein